MEGRSNTDLYSVYNIPGKAIRQKEKNHPKEDVGAVSSEDVELNTSTSRSDVLAPDQKPGATVVAPATAPASVLMT